MRYYLKNNETELVCDLIKTIKHNENYIEFHFNKDGSNCVSHIRKVANNYFSSFDGVKWSKVTKQDLPNVFLNKDNIFKVFRGFKPSGVGGENEGQLLTQMPGKIVKILVDVGQEVKVGQTLLILEAMKMENEIKCAIDGVVKNIHVNEGEALDQGVLMLEVEAIDA